MSENSPERSGVKTEHMQEDSVDDVHCETEPPDSQHSIRCNLSFPKKMRVLACQYVHERKVIVKVRILLLIIVVCAAATALPFAAS